MRHSFFTASAYHCCRILKCKQVHIDGIRIYNRVNKNNDGFHFNDGEYVHIANCDVQCQDDACALFGSNKFVTITNCTFSTRWSIFRFGGGASQNIAISNCLIYETYGCPIKISAGRASIENFTFSNIVMRNVTGPIGIGFSGGNNNNNQNTSQNTEKPFLRNIAFNGIRATVVPKPINHPDIAQCDQALFDKLSNAPQGMNLLNRYSIESNRIDEASFGIQYSYVFSKDNKVSFLLEHSPASKNHFEFTFSDDKGNVIKKSGTIKEVRQQMIVEISKTGVYLFTVHSKQSFDGCAVLQLAVANK